MAEGEQQGNMDGARTELEGSVGYLNHFENGSLGTYNSDYSQ